MVHVWLNQDYLLYLQAILILNTNEKNISAFSEKKKEQARIQGKNVNSKRKKSAGRKKSQRQKEAYCF